jgi:hypothetical protein
MRHFYQSLPRDLNIDHAYLATLCEEDGREGREPIGIGSPCAVVEPVATRQKICRMYQFIVLCSFLFSTISLTFFNSTPWHTWEDRKDPM